MRGKQKTSLETFIGRMGGLCIEEQISKSSKITKLLKSASKKGSGIGKPDFILTHNTNSKYLFVVECKADRTKHESKNKDKYKDYAVDGALLYASFLCKEYDVVAVGVSGQNKEQLCVSYHLLLKGSEGRGAIDLKIDELKKYQDVLKVITAREEVQRRDYDELLTFFKRLNKKLQNAKIKEDKRSLFVSGVLIALKDLFF